jgi:hypothetical protein
VYCEAPNLISRDAAVERATELAAETRDARAYAVDTAGVVHAAGRFVTRVFQLAFVVGVAAGVAIAELVVALR